MSDHGHHHHHDVQRDDGDRAPPPPPTDGERRPSSEQQSEQHEGGDGEQQQRPPSDHVATGTDEGDQQSEQPAAGGEEGSADRLQAEPGSVEGGEAMPVEPSLTATNDSEDSQTPALVVTTDASTGDTGEGEHLEPRDVTPSHPLPSTILSPVASPLPQSDLTAEPSPDSPDYALVAALKAQLRAVEEQRDQINTKLVRSLERCADLEDEVFHAQDGDRQKAAKIVTLEEERKEHLHALDTGLLVEEANVKNEMQRLAASLAEAQGKRELAEEGKRTVENEVDDLAASLFQQANSMVATERLARSRAETRLKEAEDNLSVAESVVREMQQAMQDLHHASQSRGLTSSASTSSLVTHSGAAAAEAVARPLRTTHLPYSEFLLFVEHVRALRPLTAASMTTPAQIPPPLLTSLLSQPLMARLLAEDHDPALRLDFAPGVGWISRKGISNAIVEGMLMVEPVSAATVFAQRPETDIVCALSGKLIVPAPPSINTSSYGYPGEGVFALAAAGLPTASGAPPSHPSRATSSRFFSRTNPSRPVSPTSAGRSSSSSTVFIFRIAPPSNVPLSEQKSSTLYPVEAGWSLDRLRATCELWRFVKTGLLQPIWAYEDGTERPPMPAVQPPQAENVGSAAAVGKKPELPPRKKSWGLSGWGLGRSSTSTPAPTPPPAATPAPKVPPRRLPPPVAEDKEVEKAEPMAPAAAAAVEGAATSAKAQETAGLDGKAEISNSTVKGTAPPPIVESSSTDLEHSEPPTPLTTDQRESVGDEAPQPTAADVGGEGDASTPSEADVPAADGHPAPTTAAPDDGGESDSFQTPTEETEAHPIEKELSDAAVEGETSVVDASADEPVEASRTQEGEAASPGDAPPATDEPSTASDVPASAAATVNGVETSQAPPTDGSAPTTGAPPPLPRRAAARRPIPPPPGSAAAAVAQASGGESSVDTDAAKPDLPARASLEQAGAPTPDGGATPPPPPKRTPAAAKADDAGAEEDASPVKAADGQQATAEDRAAKAREWELAAWRELAVVRERLFWMRIGQEPSP